MKSISIHRPSASMLIACLALFVALGGSSYAAIKVGSKQIVNNSVRSKDIRNGTIVSKDINKKTRAALKGQKGADGAPGAPGAPGTARAYAFVNADGTVDESRSKGITDANVRVDGGIYGIRGLSFSPQNVVITAAWSAAGVTGDNRGGGGAFLGDCLFVDGVDQACVSMNADGDASSEARSFFVAIN